MHIMIAMVLKLETIIAITYLFCFYFKELKMPYIAHLPTTFLNMLFCIPKETSFLWSSKTGSEFLALLMRPATRSTALI